MKTFKMLLIFSVVSAIALFLNGCISSLNGKGYLEIDSFPQGANIFINDKLVGQTPHRLEFPWTRVFGYDFDGDAAFDPQLRILLIKEGYFREERTLRRGRDVIVEEVGNGQSGVPTRARVMFYLEPSSPVSTVEKPSTPIVTPTPQQQQQMMGPTIIIGGKTVTGEEAVKIVNYGTVKFDSAPQQAEVLIEGNLIGFTPTSDLRFQVGTYSVSIIKRGYKPWKRRIMVIQDSSIVINPQLEQEES